MNKNTDLFNISFATILSLVSVYLMHLFFPILLSITVGSYIGYGYLQNTESYGNTYTLLTIIVLIIGIIGPLFHEFSLGQIDTALGVGILLLFVKLILLVPGISLRSQVVQLQLSGVTSAVASKSIIGVLLSLVSIQSVAIFAGLGLAIIPILIFESITWIFGISTHPVLIFPGLLSLGMVAIVLDLKDKAKVITNKIIDSDAKDPTTSKLISTEVAAEMCEEMDAELPPLEEVSWSRSKIENLSPEEFYHLCSLATEKDSDEEEIPIQQIKDPAPFGYGYHFTGDDYDFLEVGLALKENKESVDFDQIDKDSTDLVYRNNIEPGLIIISINTSIETQKQIEVLSNYGIYVGGIDFVRRRFEEQDVTLSSLK